MAIQHPNVFYFVLNGSWSSNNSFEFWNYKNSVTTVNNNKVNKTIYSPSPTEFKELSPAAFTGFTTTGANTESTNQFNVSGIYNKGWHFYCQPNFVGIIMFFPALGFRDINNARVNTSTGGAIAYVDNIGYYWLSGPFDLSSYARNFILTPNVVGPQDAGYRAYAFPLLINSE